MGQILEGVKTQVLCLSVRPSCSLSKEMVMLPTSRHSSVNHAEEEAEAKALTHLALGRTVYSTYKTKESSKELVTQSR